MTTYPTAAELTERAATLAAHGRPTKAELDEAAAARSKRLQAEDRKAAQAPLSAFQPETPADLPTFEDVRGEAR